MCTKLLHKLDTSEGSKDALYLNEKQPKSRGCYFNNKDDAALVQEVFPRKNNTSCSH